MMSYNTLVNSLSIRGLLADVFFICIFCFHLIQEVSKMDENKIRAEIEFEIKEQIRERQRAYKREWRTKIPIKSRPLMNAIG